METWPVSDDNFNKYCEQLLVQYKRRNTKAVTRHLKSVCDILRHEDNHVVQTKFGGSVQKGTYVTGLSDVDILLIVNQSSLKPESTEGRPWGQPLKKLEGAPLNLG